MPVEVSDVSVATTDVLFEPVAIGPVRLKNRLVMAPMGTCLDTGGLISDDTIAYYVRRAAGGIGAITVEGCLVSADSVGHELGISGPEHIGGLRALVDALRPYDLAVGVQLMHPGRQVVEGPVVAPSAIPLNSSAPIPHELTVSEIDRIVADYVAAARRAVEAGFDFIEVHGAHGYLPSNFLSAVANVRSDGYGGSLAARARFSLEVAAAIVAAVGPAVPLVWRINGDDGIDGGFTLDECVLVSQWLERAGVSALSVSGGTWQTLHITLAPMFTERGGLVPYAARVKAAVGVPVIAVGRLDDPELAAQVVRAGHADLVTIGRGLIAEPDWANKVRDHALDQLRPCIACNACVDLVGRGERVRCSVNPEVGRERTWRIESASARRRVMVVGSGPAGLEAARVARLRGHDVTLWESAAELGGKLEVAGAAPSKREVLRFRDYQIQQVRELGVTVHLNSSVDRHIVEEQRPDVVLIATGADPLVPAIAGITAAHVHDAQLVLSGVITFAAGSAVTVVGGSATGCETAELLVAAGVRTTIVEMGPSVGNGIESITRRHLIKTMKTMGIIILIRSTVIEIGPQGLTFLDAQGHEQVCPADAVVLAIGWRPRGAALARELAAGGHTQVQVIGDASRAADFVSATNSGADAGLSV